MPIFSNVYYDIINNNVVEDTKYMLLILPEQDQVIDFSNPLDVSGLMNVRYAYKTSDYLAISLSYTGSETIVDLKRLGKDIKRGIFHFTN